MPTTEYGVDQFFQNAGTSPKMVYDVAGTLVWSPHNMVLQSQTFNVSNWQAVTTVSLTVDAIAAPDGTVTAEKLASLVSGGSFHSMPYSPLIAIVAGETYTFSVYAKAAEHNWLGMETNNTNVNLSYFDLTNGVVGTRAGIHTASSITAVGNGWYRCSVTYVPSGSVGPTLHIVGANGGGSFATSIGFGLYLWGAQLNRGSVPTAYLPTTTAARYGLAIDYDPVTHAAKGLLCEPAATNLIVQSNNFAVTWSLIGATISADAVVAPDGTIGADRIVEATGTTEHKVYNAVTVTTVAYTWSVYAKAGERTWLAFTIVDTSPFVTYFDLGNGVVGNIGAGCTATITPVGNGWYRCTVTHTMAAVSTYLQCGTATGNGVNSFAGDITKGLYLWGAQLETGTVATSPIPTFAASVTRAGDRYQATPAAIGYSATAGSWWAHVFLSPSGSNPGIVGNSGGAGIPLFLHNSGGFGVQETTSVNKLGLTNYGVAHKAMSAFAAGDRAVTADGLAPATDAGATTNLLAPASLIFFGENGVGTNMNGYIRQLRYLPRRPTNAQLQTMTT